MEVAVTCPACQGTQFRYDADDDTVPYACVSCGKSMTKSQLLESTKDRITKQIAAKMKSEMKRAFAGNRNIRIR